ncbi:unnamed protein product, partial [Iphiclides podalirius]
MIFAHINPTRINKLQVVQKPSIAANYQPDTNANVNKRRPRNVLIDPVDEEDLDTMDPPPGVPPDNTTPTVSVTTITPVRPRLRARRDPNNAYTRYTRVPGRFSPLPATD